jgi:hypothetical protein
LADEQAFCSSPKLSRLDNLVVRGYYGDPLSPGNAMRAKKPKGKDDPDARLFVLAVTAFSGAVLLGLLAARHSHEGRALGLAG